VIRDARHSTKVSQ